MIARSTGGGNAALLTRRRLLLSAAIAVPPLVATGAVGVSLGQLHRFRVRKLDVDVPGLPPALDGITVAHVTDMHIGRFTFGRKVDDVARTVNALKPDLVLITGDIIDYRVADLPVAFEMLKRLERPDRVFLCEGNHDLFQSRADFEGTIDDFTKHYGIPLLVNETRLVRINGANVQVLGLRYGDVDARDYPQERQIADNMKQLRPQVLRDAFPILMAHHPHAFDPATAAGLPLTFCGHTHGGQLMLTKNLGAGPLLFKYWSGLYRKPNSRLVVANGVGNWFPLRVNAPAEIIFATLRRAEDPSVGRTPHIGASDHAGNSFNPMTWASPF